MSDDYDDEFHKMNWIRIYGDCPFVLDGQLSIDESSCDKLDKTRICNVEKHDLSSDFICGSFLTKNSTSVIVVCVVEGVTFIANLITGISLIFYAKGKYFNSVADSKE